MNSRVFTKAEVEDLQIMIETYLQANGYDPEEEIWVDGKRAQEILGVKTTQLYLLRNDPSNGITFSQPSRKVIMYLKSSLYEYLERSIV